MLKRLFEALTKSRVKEHTRKTKTGKVAIVHEHTDKRTKKAKPEAETATKAAAKTVAKKPAKKLPEPVTRTDSKGKKEVITTRQTPKRKSATAPKMSRKVEKDAAVWFKAPGGIRMRQGVVVSIGKKGVKIEGRRDAATGQKPVFTVPASDVMSQEVYKKATTYKRKTDPKVYAPNESRNATFALTEAEMEKRRKLTEKVIGGKEDLILNHPGFKGVAFKIVSELAKENGISTKLNNEKNAYLWHRAEDPEYQELLLHYFMGAMNSWRRELSKPMTSADQKAKVADFKTWLKNPGQLEDGTYPKSYIATASTMDGKREAVRYLQKMRKERNMREGGDISDDELDPASRRILTGMSGNPQQEPYTMAKRGETLKADIDSILRKLSPAEAVAMREKFGIDHAHPPVGKQTVPNEQIAAVLNHKGYKVNGKLKYTRNYVGEMFTGIYKKIKGMPEFNSLSFWVDVMQGRELNYKPVHSGRTAAGSTATQDYEREHLGKSEGHQKTICVDFDGVIADYSKGFQGDNIFGAPLPGAIKALNKLTNNGIKVIIFTTRKDSPELRKYLKDNEIPFDLINRNDEQPKTANQGKPLADIYLDDRAIRFDTWNQALDDIFAQMRSQKLQKSFSSDMQKQYPGGRWVTIKQGPLAGRHIYLLPHEDGSATVLVGGGPALRHKVLTAKRDEDAKEEQTPEEKQKKEEEKAAKEEEKPKLTEEQEAEIKEHKSQIKEQVKEEQKKMADVIRDKIGIETELTDEDREKVDREVKKRFDDKRKAGEKVEDSEEEAARKDELAKIREEKKAEFDRVMREVKLGLLNEDPAAHGPDPLPGESEEEAQERMTIAAAVKECAEDLAESHYRIQELKKQSRELDKLVKVGKSYDRFRLGEEIKASFAPISMDKIKKAIGDEEALKQELDAHYKLIHAARGIVGVEGKRNASEMEKFIEQGGFEALTGLVGGMTGNSILKHEDYKNLGPTNAAILARQYLSESGFQPDEVAGALEKFITKEGNPVAFKANEQGNRLTEMANKVQSYAEGSSNLLTMQQALGTALKYRVRAFESYGQAEGALNQGAELLYAAKNDKMHMEISANSKDAIERKRKALRLKASEVQIKHERGGDYTMIIPPRSFGSLYRVEATDKRGYSINDHSFTPQEIKDKQANIDEFRPSAIRHYTPEDKNGKSSPVNIKAEQQAAARLIAQQKRVFLNHEAGTGKSFASVLAKAHIEDTTGEKKKMIVGMPKKVMPNFIDEVRKFSNYNAVKVEGTAQQRQKILEKYADDPDTILVCSHDSFRNDTPHIKNYAPHIVVADEAHLITQRETSAGSQKSNGLKHIAKDAEYYVPMTGTATPSDLSQLYFHANLIAPERFNSQKEFMKQFGGAHKGAGYKAAISEFMNDQLDDHVYTVKKNLDTDFNLHTHHVPLTDNQKKTYKNISEDFRTGKIGTFHRENRMKSLLEASPASNNNKFSEIKKIIDNHIATKGKDEKIILYAKGVNSTLKEVKKFLGDNYPQFGHVEFTGKTKTLEANKKAFKHDPNVMFSLHSDAGVTGLNLQYDGDGGGATTAIAFGSGADSYATIDQFFSRANRTGAKKAINAHLMLTDTPYDMGTSLRLEDKKTIGELVQNKTLKRKAA